MLLSLKQVQITSCYIYIYPCLCYSLGGNFYFIDLLTWYAKHRYIEFGYLFLPNGGEKTSLMALWIYNKAIAKSRTKLREIGFACSGFLLKEP